MRALVPANGLTTLRKEMDRLFDRIWEGGLPEVTTPLGEWTPALDVMETADGVIVKAEVPGIDPKDIQVTLNDQVLTISGEKKYEKEFKDEKFYRAERSTGSFLRSFTVPVPVDGGKVRATFRNGLLTIEMPKTPAAKGMNIPIRPE